MIHFSINKAFFLKTLTATKRAISSKNAIPILSSFKIEVNKDAITLTGSNGQISIETIISSNNEDAGLLVSQTGAILLEANFFTNIVSSLPDIIFEFKEIDHQQVLLVSGKSEITLKGKDISHYPRLQEMETSQPLILKTGLFKTLINETVFAASHQESRPILTGVHFTLINNNELKAVATDSHRLSQRKMTLDKTSANFDVVIPSKSLREFSSVFTDAVETIEVFFSDSQMLFRSDTINFYTRLLEGNYPDTDRLLTNQSETTLVFNTSALRQAMERAFLVSNATQNGTVKLEITSQKVTAYVNSPEVGKVNEELDVLKLAGTDLTISFNPTYLIESLKALKSETVEIHFISPVRPFTLLPSDDKENFIQLITPVRTN